MNRNFDRYMLKCKKKVLVKRDIFNKKTAMKHCLANHWGYIVNHLIDKAAWVYFNQSGRSLYDLGCTTLEVKVKND